MSTPTFTETWLPGADGIQFLTRTYPASSPRAVVLFVHGHAEQIGRYEWAHGEYAARGITVFAFDQRGFGRTALDFENKSRGSAYGKTSWQEQLSDIEWWAKWLKRRYPELPLFLMGHSMGGTLALTFSTRTSAPPSPGTLSLLEGIISSSPLVRQTVPLSGTIRYASGLIATILPSLVVPAEVPLEHLSHDPEAHEPYDSDPFIIQKGSLKSMLDLISAGEQLLESGFKHWPKHLPLLIVHGTADKITSFEATEEFFNKVEATDKELKPFLGGYHELVHEPDGVKEKFVDECISWLLKHADAVSRM
ncbi:lysophospholipase [Trametes maxima]|nr:lysophospholipase [Trametes maxima]